MPWIMLTIHHYFQWHKNRNNPNEQPSNQPNNSSSCTMEASCSSCSSSFPPTATAMQQEAHNTRKVDDSNPPSDGDSHSDDEDLKPAAAVPAVAVALPGDGDSSQQPQQKQQQQQQQQKQQPLQTDRDDDDDDDGESSSSSCRKLASERRHHHHHHRRRQALERVGINAARYWTSLPSPWRTDKEFVLHALRNSPTLPPKSDLERQFPQSLRFDRDVVLAFCQRPDFETLYHERHLFVPGCLTSDKEVMMAYCQRIPRSLQECTEDLCNDPEVVQAAISFGGLELQYASLRLQEDLHMVQQACQSHGRALEYCPPGPTRDALTCNKTFMRDVVLAQPGGGPMWKLASLELQQDPDLLLQALQHGLGWRDVPDPFADDLDFLQQALEINASLYLQLVPPLQAQQSLTRRAILSPNSTPDVHDKALQHWPTLRKERPIVLSLCQRGHVDTLSDLLSLPSSEAFRDDVEIMEVAIRRDSNLLSVASPRLRISPRLILVSITPMSAWNTLKSIPSSLMRQHPEIPIRAVQVSVGLNLRYLPGHLPDDIWANSRELCLAWLRRGGRVLEAFESLLVLQPPNYTEEEIQLPLAVAQYNWSECYKVGDALLRHRDFVVRALALDGRILRFAPLALRQEFEIQVLAVANHNNNILLRPPSSSSSSSSSYSHSIGGHASALASNNHSLASSSTLVATTLGGSIDIPKLSTQIQDKLQLHQTFYQDFLRGIAIARPHQPPQLRSQLPMLDRGVETSQAFKQLIAEYLGVPLGTHLSLLRRAHANLSPSSSSLSSPLLPPSTSSATTTTTTNTSEAVASAVSPFHSNHTFSTTASATTNQASATSASSSASSSLPPNSAAARRREVHPPPQPEYRLRGGDLMVDSEGPLAAAAAVDAERPDDDNGDDDDHNHNYDDPFPLQHYQRQPYHDPPDNHFHDDDYAPGAVLLGGGGRRPSFPPDNNHNIQHRDHHAGMMVDRFDHHQAFPPLRHHHPNQHPHPHFHHPQQRDAFVPPGALLPHRQQQFLHRYPPMATYRELRQQQHHHHQMQQQPQPQQQQDRRFIVQLLQQRRQRRQQQEQQQQQAEAEDGRQAVGARPRPDEDTRVDAAADRSGQGAAVAVSASSTSNHQYGGNNSNDDDEDHDEQDDHHDEVVSEQNNNNNHNTNEEFSASAPVEDERGPGLL